MLKTFKLHISHFRVSWQQDPYLKPLIPSTSLLDLLILNLRWMLLADITFLCLLLCISEGLHRFCHQCEAPDPLHAPESPHFPISSVALCGVTVFWIHRPGHDCSQHHCADDEGEENAKKKRKNTSGEFGIVLLVCRLLREKGRQMQGDSACIKYWSIYPGAAI